MLCRSTSTRISESTQPSIALLPSTSSWARRRTTCPATNSTIWKGAPSTVSSSHSAIARATGTGCPAAPPPPGIHEPCRAPKASTHATVAAAPANSSHRRRPGMSDWSGRRRSARRVAHPLAPDRVNADTRPARPGRGRRVGLPKSPNLFTTAHHPFAPRACRHVEIRRRQLPLGYHRWFRGSRSHTCSVEFTVATVAWPVRENSSRVIEA